MCQYLFVKALFDRKRSTSFWQYLMKGWRVCSVSEQRQISIAGAHTYTAFDAQGNNPLFSCFTCLKLACYIATVCK